MPPSHSFRLPPPTSARDVRRPVRLFPVVSSVFPRVAHACLPVGTPAMVQLSSCVHSPLWRPISSTLTPTCPPTVRGRDRREAMRAHPAPPLRLPVPQYRAQLQRACNWAAWLRVQGVSVPPCRPRGECVVPNTAVHHVLAPRSTFSRAHGSSALPFTGLIPRPVAPARPSRVIQ